MHTLSLSFSPVYPLLLQPSPQRLPSSCAFLPYLAPTPSTFLLSLLQLFTSSTANVSFYLVAFESSVSLPPPCLHHLPFLFRQVLCSFPIFGSCRSLTPPSSSDSACIPVSGSLPVSVKRHSRLSFVRTNLDSPPSASLFLPFSFLSSSLSSSLVQSKTSRPLSTIAITWSQH